MKTHPELREAYRVLSINTIHYNRREVKMEVKMNTKTYLLLEILASIAALVVIEIF